VGDYVLEHAAEFMAPPAKELNESVAVVGAGPAGLSAAFYLRKEGYSVTVFDQMPEAGGMLTYGIPPYRLPREVLRKQIRAFDEMGIQFKTGVAIGRAARRSEICGRSSSTSSWRPGRGGSRACRSRNRSCSARP